MSWMYKLFKIKRTADDHIENLIIQTPNEINIQFEKDRHAGYRVSLQTENETRDLGLFRSIDVLGFPVLTPGDEARALQYSLELMTRLNYRSYDPKINGLPANEFVLEKIESLKKIGSLYSKLVSV